MQYNGNETMDCDKSSATTNENKGTDTGSELNDMHMNEKEHRMPEVPMSTHGDGRFSKYEEHGVQSKRPIIEGNKTVATGRPSVMLHRLLSTSVMEANGASCDGIKHPDLANETPSNNQRRSSYASQLRSQSRHGEDMAADMANDPMNQMAKDKANDMANDRDMENDQRNQFGPYDGHVQPVQVDEPMNTEKPMKIEEREQAAENSANSDLPNFHQISIEVALAPVG